MSSTVAILGRPNVGKSTLFNRLVGRRRALVDDSPGVTRDRIIDTADLLGPDVRLIDTAGLAPDDHDTLAMRMRRQTEEALEEADLVLFLVDAAEDLTALDREIAELLRRQDKPVILVANKCDIRQAEANLYDAFDLGLGEPIAISAAHGQGLDRLADAVREMLAQIGKGGVSFGDSRRSVEPGDAPPGIRIALAGRPNTGKSSLANRLLGEDRLLTGPEPGLTRDAVYLPWRWNDREFVLVDTAGLRRKARIDSPLEKVAASASLDAIRRADVVLLVLDATAPLEKQDLTVANRAIAEGRSLVIAANKWDLVEDAAARIRAIRRNAAHRLSQVRGVPVIPVSARTGHNLDRLMTAVLEIHDRWSRRIATGPLNRWLSEVVLRHPPPMIGGRRAKLRYATQTRTRPPSLVIFANRPAQKLPPSYRRYLLSEFRRSFDLEGVPVRIEFRTGENPFAEGTSPRRRGTG